MGRVFGSGPLGKRRGEGGGERTQGCWPMYVTAKQRRVEGLNQEEGGEGSTSSAATTKWSSDDDLASSPDCALVIQMTGDGGSRRAEVGSAAGQKEGNLMCLHEAPQYDAVRATEYWRRQSTLEPKGECKKNSVERPFLISL